VPLHVAIFINRHLLSEIHIARAEGGTDPDDINTYIAVTGDEPIWLEDYEASGVTYEHRYGDGAQVCVRKAIEALEKTTKEKL
jgi:hypothetical protein